jgi:integrase
MAGLRPPAAAEKLVPVLTADELSRIDQVCAGRTFAQRRDAAIIAVFLATGIRLAEMAGIRYDPGDPRRSDIDVWQREITVRGKGGKARMILKRSLDRYIRSRSRHAQAWRQQLWLGINNQGPMTASGDMPDGRIRSSARSRPYLGCGRGGQDQQRPGPGGPGPAGPGNLVPGPGWLAGVSAFPAFAPGTR